LKHPYVQGLDVIDEIEEEHHNISKLPIEDDESSEDQESGLLFFLAVLIRYFGLFKVMP